MIRLFVGIDPGERVKDTLMSFCFKSAGLRWVPRANLHTTLAFIGEVQKDRYLEIRKTLGEIDSLSFDLSAKGVGSFSRKGQISSIYVNIQKNDALTELHLAVKKVLIDSGLKIENRNYRPHITLARCKNINPIDIAGFLSEHAMFGPVSVNTSSFNLYSSKITSKGSIYSVEENFELY